MTARVAATVAACTPRTHRATTARSVSLSCPAPDPPSSGSCFGRRATYRRLLGRLVQCSLLSFSDLRNSRRPVPGDHASHGAFAGKESYGTGSTARSITGVRAASSLESGVTPASESPAQGKQLQTLWRPCFGRVYSASRALYVARPLRRAAVGWLWHSLRCCCACFPSAGGPPPSVVVADRGQGLACLRSASPSGIEKNLPSAALRVADEFRLTRSGGARRS